MTKSLGFGQNLKGFDQNLKRFGQILRSFGQNPTNVGQNSIDFGQNIESYYMFVIFTRLWTPKVRKMSLKW